ncbi:MAG: DUF4214 domain-containing protein [Caldimonas sp.]
MLRLDDAAFVNSAYWAVLLRQADAGGRAHYLAQLQAGTAKEEILFDLVRSDEGRRAASTLNGLAKVVAAHRRSRLTLSQRLVRYLFKGVIAHTDKGLRRLENLVIRQSSASTSHRLDQLELQLLRLGDPPASPQRAPEGSHAASGAAESTLPMRPAPVVHVTTGSEHEAPLALAQLTEQERYLLRKISRL